MWKNNNMNPNEYVNIDIDYDRPSFNFPTSMEGGNPLVYWKEAQGRLRSLGFKKESEEIGDYKEYSYAEQFNVLASYLKFSNNGEIISEDDGYIIIKKEKEKNIKQLDIFNMNSKMLKSLVENNFDFSVTNAYGRNIFYYLNNIEDFELFLNHKNTKNLFNPFDIDNLQSNLLYCHSNNIKTFDFILEKMIEIDKSSSLLFLRAYNIYNKHPLQKFLSNISPIFKNEASLQANKENLPFLFKISYLFEKIEPSLSSNFLNCIYSTQLMKDKANKSLLDDAYKISQHLILESKLEKNSKKKSLSKI
jgi:hypothetical protein